MRNGLNVLRHLVHSVLLKGLEQRLKSVHYITINLAALHSKISEKEEAALSLSDLCLQSYTFTYYIILNTCFDAYHL